MVITICYLIAWDLSYSSSRRSGAINTFPLLHSSKRIPTLHNQTGVNGERCRSAVFFLSRHLAGVLSCKALYIFVKSYILKPVPLLKFSQLLRAVKLALAPAYKIDRVVNCHTVSRMRARRCPPCWSTSPLKSSSKAPLFLVFKKRRRQTCGGRRARPVSTCQTVVLASSHLSSSTYRWCHWSILLLQLLLYLTLIPACGLRDAVKAQRRLYCER